MEEQSPHKIFISYRRSDSAGHSGRLFDHLQANLPDADVFMDVAGIDPGEGWREVIENEVGSCDILLVVIGQGWLSCYDDFGRRRLDSPDDVVKFEIKVGLENRDVRVVPVLVGGTAMPNPDGLPDEIAELGEYNAFLLDDLRFAEDVKRLCEAIERIYSKTSTRANPNLLKLSGQQLPPEWEIAPMGELVNVDFGQLLKSEEIGLQGFPYYNISGIAGYVADYQFDGDYLIMARVSHDVVTRKRPIVFRENGKFAASPNMFVISTHSEDSPRGLLSDHKISLDYLQYFLSYVDLSDSVEPATLQRIPRMRRSSFMSIDVWLPPLKEQQQIVDYIRDTLQTIEKRRNTLNSQLEALNLEENEAVRLALSSQLTRDN